jgi:hypothetical protein
MARQHVEDRAVFLLSGGEGITVVSGDDGTLNAESFRVVDDPYVTMEYLRLPAYRGV